MLVMDVLLHMEKKLEQHGFTNYNCLIVNTVGLKK